MPRWKGDAVSAYGLGCEMEGRIQPSRIGSRIWVGHVDASGRDVFLLADEAGF